MTADEARLPVAVRAGTGWQTLMADLSIILFMVAASVVSRTSDTPPPPARVAVAGPSPQGEPLALYRDEPGAPPLAEWLAAQAPDRRQQLTITARYPPGGQAQAMARALARAQALAAAAGAAGLAARIVVEPQAGVEQGGAGGNVTAALAYDVPAR